MPTKTARFGFSRTFRDVRPVRFTRQQRAQLRAICSELAFMKDVRRVAEHYRDFCQAIPMMQSPAESELALRALIRNAHAIPNDSTPARRAVFFERLESLSASAAAYLQVGVLEAGLPWTTRLDFGALDSTEQTRWIAALEAGAKAAAEKKSRAAQRGVWLERHVAAMLRDVFERHGVRFYLSRNHRCNAVDALSVVMPNTKRGTLENYVRHACQSRRTAG